ncbi:hypothetical protein GCM10009733_082770 [Nonomuraea maheshkhaliensis]|uniref:Uncharacterized protein n=1 Tax=Nonomuraea maheshkhaliensis TaxID=419590 RepID=A0ABP4SK41_9ACTN
MGPNEIDIVRVYPTESKSDVADETPLTVGGTSFDVVVEAECGSARADGAPFEVAIMAFDYSAGTNPSSYGNFSQSDSGTLDVPDWPKYRKRFTIDITNIGAVDGHVMQYTAILRAAAGPNRVAKFASSPMFIVQQ